MKGVQYETRATKKQVTVHLQRPAGANRLPRHRSGDTFFAVLFTCKLQILAPISPGFATISLEQRLFAGICASQASHFAPAPRPVNDKVENGSNDSRRHLPRLTPLCVKCRDQNHSSARRRDNVFLTSTNTLNGENCCFQFERERDFYTA